MNIIIIKYNAGNTRSVTCALNRLGIEPIITDNLALLAQQIKLFFPGVGQANSAMAYCQQKGLDSLLPNLKQPVLGICLGLQLFCQCTEEENTPCLNIFDIKIKKFKVDYKIPQIGWNKVFNLKSNLFKAFKKITMSILCIVIIHRFRLIPYLKQIMD